MQNYRPSGAQSCVRSALSSLILLMIVMLSAEAVQAQDTCGDILQGGIFDVFVLDIASVQQDLFQSQYCSQDSESRSSQQGLDLGVLSPKGKVDLNWSSMSKEERYRAFCDYKLEETFDAKSLSSFSQSASALIVDAWKECMQTGGGVRFSYRQSDDQRFVRLTARNGIQGINGLSFSSGQLKDQITVLPPNGLDCGDASFEAAAESDIVCERKIIDQSVSVKLRNTVGDQPEIVLAVRRSPASPPVLPDDLEVSEGQLLLKQNLRGSFRAVVGGGQAFARALDLHPGPDDAAGLIQIAVPAQAKRFTGKLIWNTGEHCDRSQPRDSSTVVIRLAGLQVKNFDVLQDDSRIQAIDIDLRQIAAGAPRVLEISVSPGSNRICDQVAIADPMIRFQS